ncbi:GAF domain-containing protein [uncultured Ramlibacter sp.]|uniref:GAF domain-containing protein n=1 Tax=uncultured Ramlibacter sp. TaxID=260755 RepID=UPI002638276D|nr:GAF domain-containing protein [uncultured Ramlibacter sp.]
MLSTPVFQSKLQPSQVLSDNYLSPVPRDERYERITRTAMRLLEIPMAFIAMEQEEAKPWLRSAHGLPAHQTRHALQFCAAPVDGGQARLETDASLNPVFWDNPLVTGPTHVRSLLSVPLYLDNGERAGALCAMDTTPHAFRQSHVQGLQDLARLAEAELRLDVLADSHKRALIRLGQMERRALYERVAGGLPVRRFRELLSGELALARQQNTSLALCYLRVRNMDELAGVQDRSRAATVRQLIAQVLRQRLPDDGALTALGNTDFCALVPGATAAAVDELLASLRNPRVALDAPGIRLDLELQLGLGLARLDEMPATASAIDIWATTLARLEPLDA